MPNRISDMTSPKLEASTSSKHSNEPGRLVEEVYACPLPYYHPISRSSFPIAYFDTLTAFRYKTIHRASARHILTNLRLGLTYRHAG